MANSTEIHEWRIRLGQLNIKLHIILQENLINYFFILMRTFMENIQNSDKYVGKKQRFLLLIQQISVVSKYYKKLCGNNIHFFHQ